MVADTGQSIATRGLVLQVCRQKDNSEKKNAARIGLTVTKKVGNAVTRNKIKRRLRNISREVVANFGLPGYDYVIIGRHKAIDRSYTDLKKDLEYALKKANREEQ